MDIDERKQAAGARSLGPEELELLRRRAVAAVESGTPQTQVARLFGVSRKTVGNWMRAYEAIGESAFRPRRRGRRAGERLALSADHQAWVVRTVASGPPEAAGLPSLLWTRKVLVELIRREFGISLAAGTIDQYLRRWELSGTGPGRCEQGSLLMAWTRPRCPDGGERRHALVAVNHRGLLFFVAADSAFTPAQLTDFRNRLRVQLGGDFRLIVTAWPAAHSRVLTRWRTTIPVTVT